MWAILSHFSSPPATSNAPSIDIGNHPLFNLIDFQEDGAEAIWEGPLGLHQFAAINGQGKIVEQVPDDIATDSTVPSPHNANCCKLR